MQLVIKTNAAPPRLGIQYTYDYQAVKAYENLFLTQKGTLFTARLEPVRGKLDLTLVSEENGLKFPYKDLDFKMEGLQKLSLLKPPALQFVHIFPRANDLFVAKPFRKQMFITITAFEIAMPGIFGDVM